MPMGGSSAYAYASQSLERHPQHTGGGTGRADSQGIGPLWSTRLVLAIGPVVGQATAPMVDVAVIGGSGVLGEQPLTLAVAPAGRGTQRA